MNLELKLILPITRNLPPMRGMIRVGRKFRDFYLRKQREPVTANVHNFKMRLYPNESFSNSACLFYPQLYDFREIKFLKQNLKKGDTFLDVGAHIGYYSLVASRLVGDSGKVLAVEADPHTYKQLADNIQLNKIQNIARYNHGVSDKEEVLELGIDENQRGKNSFLQTGDRVMQVKCLSLADVIKKASLANTKIKGIKIDVEGFEYKALKPFLESTEKQNLPEFVIVEYNSDVYQDKLENLLKNTGYTLRQYSGKNRIYTRNL